MAFLSANRKHRRVVSALLGVFCLTGGNLYLEAQGPPGTPPAQVRYTQAREHTLRRSLALPGSVEARTTSTVASSVAGLVVEFPAKEGLRVEAGQKLAQLRTTTQQIQLTSQKASLREAEARLKLAETRLKRARELFQQGIIAQQEADDAQSEFNAWQGRVDSLTAEVARIEDEIERCTIIAPFGGVVTRELTEVGQWVITGGPVVSLLAIDEVEIRIEVPERYFSSIRVGVNTSVTFESLPGLVLQGRVISVIPQADAQSRTFPAKVLVSNRSGRIGAGMLAAVSFPAGETYRATMIPKDAVVTRGPRQFVYRVNGDNTVEELAVETGSGAGAWIEVRGGVLAGDKVVTRGNERLRPGQPVQASVIEYERPT